LKVTVYTYASALIETLATLHCFKDSNIHLALTPANGLLVGSTTDSTYNAALQGAGSDTLIYTFGVGQCFTSDTLVVSVLPELVTTVSVSQDTVCQGGGAVIDVSASGGDPTALYSYTWNQGLLGLPSQNVAPTATTTYVVVTSDGCSDPAVDSIVISVFSPFSADFEFSPQACYDEPGFVTGTVPFAGSYTFRWDQTLVGDTLFANAGSLHTVTVTEDSSGCQIDTLLSIPSYTPITADFSPNPSLDCIPFENGTVTFIDLSNNALAGTWYFNQDSVPYQPGQNGMLDITTPGLFDIQLIVENEGGCTDSAFYSICILEPSPIFIPDAFSPNGDGSNDVLFVRGNSIRDMDFMVFDRWGGKVFESNSSDQGWDGTRFGSAMPEGVYVYLLTYKLAVKETYTQQGEILLLR